MQVKTVDDERVNTNTLVEIRTMYVKEHDYTVAIRQAVTGQNYFLQQQLGVGWMNKWIAQFIDNCSR